MYTIYSNMQGRMFRKSMGGGGDRKVEKKWGLCAIIKNVYILSNQKVSYRLT